MSQSKSSAPTKQVAATTLEVALKHAAEITEHLSSDLVLSEETLTGSVLGSLSASLGAFAKSANVDKSFDENSYRWARYTKNPASDPESEALNGADFALILVFDNGQRRIAIFQAKKGLHQVWALLDACGTLIHVASARTKVGSHDNKSRRWPAWQKKPCDSIIKPSLKSVTCLGFITSYISMALHAASLLKIWMKY